MLPQVELTNDGVPVAIVDSDAEQEVPHNCVIQNPWTLTQGVKTVNLWDYNSDEPLLRVTIIRFTRLGSTSIGLSGSHAVGTSRLPPLLLSLPQSPTLR